MYTSSVRRGTPANHYETLEETLTALLEDRAKGRGHGDSPSDKGR